MKKATLDNTAFITIAAFDRSDEKTTAIRMTAEKNDIPLTYYDEGETWRGFYFHKIQNMRERLRQLGEQGKEYVFLLDSRDVVFIDHVDVILQKFNAINQGKAIFNLDMPGGVWPSLNDDLHIKMKEAMGSEHAQLNAGMIASEIETLLKIQSYVVELREELIAQNPRDGILSQLFHEYDTNFTEDDQYLYQVCLTYYPELFHIDSQKKLFAVLFSFPHDLHECSDDPKRHDVIGEASLIHSPWLAWSPDWLTWVRENRWNRT